MSGCLMNNGNRFGAGISGSGFQGMGGPGFNNGEGNNCCVQSGMNPCCMPNNGPFNGNGGMEFGGGGNGYDMFGNDPSNNGRRKK
uniref:Uncharacterized protein n=1 Tax=Ditylenchus dipsaci TaxID=166011 RepID=A0A915EL29_9BILA